MASYSVAWAGAGREWHDNCLSAINKDRGASISADHGSLCRSELNPAFHIERGNSKAVALRMKEAISE